MPLHVPTLVLVAAGLVTAGWPGGNCFGAPKRVAGPKQNRQESQRRRNPLTVADAPDGIEMLLTAIALENLPHQYEETKHWGRQKEVFRGLQFRREGLKIETKRRSKYVNHGTWSKYQIHLVDPRNNLTVRIRNVHGAGDGKVGFELAIGAKLSTSGRVSQWQRGVQLISISTDAVADVELRMQCQMRMKLDPNKLPPDVILALEVTGADVHLRTFRVNRISKADGPLVRQLGRSLQGVVMRRIDAKKERLVNRINHQIAKHDDQLRLSLHDFVAQKWRQLVGSSPPES